MKKTIFNEAFFEELKEEYRRGNYKKLADVDIWENEDSFEYNVLSEAIKNNKNNKKNFKPGDIVLVNQFNNETQDKIIDNKTHRVLIMTDLGTEPNECLCFALSSQIIHSNKFDSSHKNHIYIDDYTTILKTVSAEHKPVYINLNDLVSITNDDAVIKLGEASPKFMTFVIDTRRKISKGEDASGIYWENISRM